MCTAPPFRTLAEQRPKTAPQTQGGGLCTLCHLLASAAPTLALPSLNVPAVPSPRRLPLSDAALFRLRRVCPRPPRSAWSILQVLQCQLPSGSVTLIVQRVCLSHASLQAEPFTRITSCRPQSPGQVHRKSPSDELTPLHASAVAV